MTSTALHPTTNLFLLAEIADKFVVAGYEVDFGSIDSHFGPEFPPTLRLSFGDDVDYFFYDQEVELLDDGEVLAFDCSEDADVEPIKYRIRFTKEVPLSTSDLLAAATATV